MFMFGRSKNCSEISSSRGQAILMGNNLPPVLLAAYPAACHHIPVQRSGREIQEAPSGNQNTVAGNPLKRKRYRYSELQVKFLEAYFKECPLPNHMQMNVLGDALAIEPMKVMFWFQKKHTELGLRLDDMKKIDYQAENQKLLTENFMLKRALAACTCQICGSPLANRDIMTSPEELLRLENVKLREKINRMTCAILRFGGNPWANSTSIRFPLSNHD